jgi:site-specific recombinase XerD
MPPEPLLPTTVQASGLPFLHGGGRDDLVPLYLLRYDKANTKRSYGNDLRQFFGNGPVTVEQVREVSFVDVNMHLEALQASGASVSTIQRRTAALRGFYNWLVALKVVESSPADRQLVRRATRGKRSDRLVQVLTAAEARALVDAVDLDRPTGLRDRALLLTLLHAVLRRSEAAAMNMEHIAQAGPYWVLTIPHAKGGDGQFVKLPPQVVDGIKEYASSWGFSVGPVWRSVSNNSRMKRLSAYSIYSIVSRTAKKAGIVDTVGAHALRHTGCTLAIEAGATVQQVKEHARHKNLETTMIYVHQRDRLADSAADYIEF